MIQREFEFKGMYCKKWLAENQSARLVIIHGLGEMSEYYKQMAEYFCNSGVSMYLPEYRNHGRTTLDAEIDDALRVTSGECLAFSKYVKQQSDKPLFMLGHSLGSQIAQYMLNTADKPLFDGVILTGCPEFENIEQLLCDIEAEIKERGKLAPCQTVFMKIFGHVADPFPEKCTVSWVTSDLERAEYYEKLPYTNVMYTCGYYKSFLSLAAEVQKEDYLLRAKYKPPVLVLGGGMDTVGKFGYYTIEKINQLKKAGFDAQGKLYDGMRHSILQEKGREGIYADILRFMKNCINAAK